MGLIEKILGPKSKYDKRKSKYDKSLPLIHMKPGFAYSKGARNTNSYLADTICGLVEYLHRNGIKPDEVQIVEVYQEQEFPIDAKRFTTPDNQWLFKPDICRAFEDHYKGHIQADTCSFNDRDCKGSVP